MTWGSWVEKMKVVPVARLRRSITSSSEIAVAESRFAVGSSARMSAGSVTIARATATRCCCPPDNSAGRRSSRPARPISANSFFTFSLRVRAGTPCSSKVNSRILQGGKDRQQVVGLEDEADALQTHTSQFT